MSGPYQNTPQVSDTFVFSGAQSGRQPVKLSWFQRWFLKHSQQAWQHGNQDRNMKTSAIHGQTVTRELNTRNSVDLSLIRADGGWIVQFQTYDDNHDRHNVYHHVIPDSEDFGPKLAEIVTLQCMR
jgi:hypothetical protein